MIRGAAITSIGFVTAAGDDPIRLAAAPRARSTAPDGTAPIEGFDVTAYVQRKGMRHLSRTSQLACAAAARIAPALAGVAPEQVGVVLGSAWAALDTIVRFEREAWIEGPRLVDPLLFTETVPNVPAGQVSIVFGWSALNMTLGGGAMAGFEALARALDLLEEERAPVMVAGGADALHTHLVRTLAAGPTGSRQPCGEAACLLALESPVSAERRGAAPLGCILALGGRALGRAEDPDRALAELLRALVDEARLPGAVDLVVRADGEAPSEPSIALQVGVLGESARAAATVPRHLGQTWAASGPLAVVMALEGLHRCASATARPAYGIVLAGANASERALSALALVVEPRP